MNAPTPHKGNELSFWWIFLAINYAFCDILSLMEPATLRALLQGGIGNLRIDQTFLLWSGVMMEIPFAMILLSRTLPEKVTPCANILASLAMIAVQVGSFFMGDPPTLHYLFFSGIEILALLAIFAQALRWRICLDRGACAEGKQSPAGNFSAMHGLVAAVLVSLPATPYAQTTPSDSAASPVPSPMRSVPSETPDPTHLDSIAAIRNPSIPSGTTPDGAPSPEVSAPSSNAGTTASSIAGTKDSSSPRACHRKEASCGGTGFLAMPTSLYETHSAIGLGLGWQNDSWMTRIQADFLGDFQRDEYHWSSLFSLGVFWIHGDPGLVSVYEGIVVGDQIGLHKSFSGHVGFLTALVGVRFRPSGTSTSAYFEAGSGAAFDPEEGAYAGGTVLTGGVRSDFGL
ncbi:MAG: hypothetical protein H6686_09385 [Fibrobacteria bacterium]|nr:hypothetical protein [Fibrobacteria bacterium]